MTQAEFGSNVEPAKAYESPVEGVPADEVGSSEADATDESAPADDAAESADSADSAESADDPAVADLEANTNND